MVTASCASFFLLSDVSRDSYEAESKSQKFVTALKQGIVIIARKPAILSAFLGLGSSICFAFGMLLFGIPMMLLQYEDTESAQNYENTRIGKMIFFTQIGLVPFVIGFGIMQDKFPGRNWIFTLLIAVLACLSATGLFISSGNFVDANLSKGQNSSVFQVMCFCCTYGCAGLGTVTNLIYLAKSIKDFKEFYGVSIRKKRIYAYYNSKFNQIITD